jgi:ABC-type transport system substrate-binding protein
MRAKMRNKLHARVIPAIAAGLFGVAMLGASALPASAAAGATARSSVRMEPAPWTIYPTTYPTKFACQEAGENKVFTGAAESYYCTEVTDGDFFVWELHLFT